MSNEYECFSGLYFWPAPSACWVRPTSPFSTPLPLSRMTTLTQRQSKISHKSKWTQMFASKVIKNIFSRYSRLKRMSKVVHSAERWFFLKTDRWHFGISKMIVQCRAERKTWHKNDENTMKRCWLPMMVVAEQIRGEKTQVIKNLDSSCLCSGEWLWWSS